jgi:hypothetical protein
VAAAAFCSICRRATNAVVSAETSHVPLAPSVQIRWWTMQPCAAHLASVPPHWNSTSSGCAAMANATDGTARLLRMTGSWPRVGLGDEADGHARQIVGQVDVPAQLLVEQHANVDA